MQLECDFALIGTGIAPLITAQRLVERGYSVLLLNSDSDFFMENSELPLEPVLLDQLEDPLKLKKIQDQRLERAREILAPQFPGALEEWPRSSKADGYESFQDPTAPFLRARQWNWIVPSVDEPFLRLLESGSNPRVTQGLAAARRFPGYNWQKNLYPSFQSIGLDRLVDVDLDRYRNGVLEFIRARLSHERVLSSISGLELVDAGLRFIHSGIAMQVRVQRGVWVFWTPHVTTLVEKILGKYKQEQPIPSVSCLGWEEWSLRSREPIDPTHVGLTMDAVAWARADGEPQSSIMELNVLIRSDSDAKLVGSDSFTRLARFVQQFLNWERFRIRDLKTRVMLAGTPEEWNLTRTPVPVRLISGCEGSLVSVVNRVVRLSEDGS